MSSSKTSAKSHRKTGKSPEKGKVKTKLGVTDIARQAGLSTGLVSSFLNGRYHSKDRSAVVGISDESTQRIRDACEHLGYEPGNPLWRARIYPDKADLTFLLSNAVGLGFGNDYFGRMVLALADAAREEGVRTGFALFDPKCDYTEDNLAFPPGTTEGLSNKFVIAGPVNHTLVNSLMEQGNALIFLSRASGIPGTVSIVPDYFSAAAKAVEMLYAHGHRRIAVAGAHYYRDAGYNFQQLRRGALKAAKDLALPLSDGDIHISSQRKIFDNPAFLKGILDKSDNYSAVFCLDDSTAHALYLQAEMLGLQIPEDISLVGCNDESVASILRPSLSTIHFPVRRMGRLALQESLRVIREGHPEQDEIIVLPTAPILRQSIHQVSSNRSFDD